jgi:hypothetical protein
MTQGKIILDDKLGARTSNVDSHKEPSIFGSQLSQTLFTLKKLN